MTSVTEDDARAGLFVVIPTTSAPITIRQLMWSARIPRSRVVLANETSDECKRWSDDYNSLLRTGDPFRTLLDLPEGGSYRLVATGDIDQGRSWMTAVAGAHVALARGVAPVAKASDAKLMLWGTGGVDLSTAATLGEAAVVAADYHLATKIDRSREQFAEAAHAEIPVLCLLPDVEEAERASGVLAKVLAKQAHHIVVVGSLADIVAPIEHFLANGAFPAPAAKKPEAPQPATAVGTSLVMSETADKSAGRKAPPPPGGEKPAGPSAAAEPRETRSAPGYGSASASAGRPPVAAAKRTPALIAAAVVVLVAGAAGAYVALRPSTAPVSQPPVEGQQQTTQQQQPPQPPANQQQATVSPPSGEIVLPPTTPPGTPVDPNKPPEQLPPGTKSVARLTLITAPAGSSCAAQVYEMRPTWTTSVVEVPEGAPSVEVDGANLCGLEVSGVGEAKVGFKKGSGPRVVASQSSSRRLVFNPADMRDGGGSLPSIQIDGPAPGGVEIRRR